ncbi:pilus assembly protein TadG-related protein [Candidatus Contubernalis alkaliaceticus]|uniref:pilus assembly protein TadG-related protein n=1 Tax=Candidatus Contubernalis alkaliaceticus TaxID=338645 RepID=UPI001F4C3E87|nr:pilus assembly protein TadG-related protein [Candidatus Contubernalis alkalaceticus]UNC93455.1 hypothetical protein HUE98_16045 [Candidatus Contubernalis alkalaceticus]
MHIKKLLRDEKGTALVLFALAIFVLFGFAALVIDVGDMYVERRNMVTAADAAALAGVKELALTQNPEQAKIVAKEYGENKNGADICEVEIVTIDGEMAVQVKASVNKEQYFAKLIGFSDVMVSASASAIWGYPTGFNNLLPIYYEDEGLELPVGEQVLLAPKLGPGNWGLLDVGSGKKDVNLILTGEPSGELVSIGEILWSEPGNAQSRVNAIEERMQRAKTPNSGVKMEGVIPIIEVVGELSGKSKLQVVGFASIRIIDVITDETKEKDDNLWYGKGSVHAHLPNAPRLYAEGYEKKQDLTEEFPKGAVICEFLSFVFMPATEWISSSQDPAHDYGMYMVRLVQ